VTTVLPTESTLSDEEQALLPSDAEVEFYAEHGWYLTRKLFTDDEVDELVAASERFYAGERDRTLPVRPPKLAYWEPGDGAVFFFPPPRRGWRGPTRSGSSSPR
jgi:hypothetical protein